MHAGVLDITITLVIFHCREPKNIMFYVIGVISGARFVQQSNAKTPQPLYEYKLEQSGPA
jgi:hypothetical protein